MVIHQIAFGSGIKELPGTSIHFIDIDFGVHFPKVLQNRLKE
jgi:hypothetical protein